ncbi:hypothetical protein [Acuticoccus kandeliae]|uniref:hypothetical protein n=1 Tax=Acuticoccus kandeliae TaxID=2073160 RepID=UPI0013005057|nr:hypothetical protein [Acuticoccus kandeliae]
MTVANKSYVVNDRIAYEAQLIMALINTRAGLRKRLDYEWTGDGNDLRCVVTGTLLDGEVCAYESPPMGAITPKNSPLWKVDPKRQLAYWTARAWARVHTPEVMLGVDCVDDMKDSGGPRDVTRALISHP